MTVSDLRSHWMAFLGFHLVRIFLNCRIKKIGHISSNVNYQTKLKITYWIQQFKYELFLIFNSYGKNLHADVFAAQRGKRLCIVI